ncbi:cbb3-type cytochrome c oxidase N-terminal domain-containing protein [Dyadobacter sp. MSC1_007]|jgi:cytochrome c oxidase cbb3-type subunit 3|uniref:cbb3-type cytochrome c oxidase N-terminal domain-containing protein n=1 Tax=Dyadobacter sp. MSC1_007 TaxID=2909264 RepID=UPI00202F8D2A|nr:cbb3-type cytochrome c oxidase N-terminal domain-containing protein [Dyadobacter sp. MSC1_007]
MKFRNYLETIAGVGIYPLISLIIFFVFFIGLLIYVMRLDKKSLDHMRGIPLNDGIVRKGLLSIALLVFLALPSYAQTPAETRAVTGLDLILYAVLAVMLFIIIQLAILLGSAMQLLNKTATKEEKEPKHIFSRHWWRAFRGISVELRDEQKILIEGHDYDGIQELDNRMPPWLQSLFYATILFAAVYSAYYFGGFGDMQLAELDKEIATAEVEKKAYMEQVGASMDENSVTLLTEKAGIDQGKKIFQEKCTACHGAEGGGSVGPNLTDDYWLHGAGIQNLFKVIKYGVPEKGMISWEKQLSPTDIQKVASFVVSLKGTKPANAKEPQGEIAGDQLTAVNKP